MGLSMSSNDDLAFTSATELRALIASGEVSPVEATELYLDRIERLRVKESADA